MCQMEMGIYVFVIERTPRAEGNKSSIRVPTDHARAMAAILQQIKPDPHHAGIPQPQHLHKLNPPWAIAASHRQLPAPSEGLQRLHGVQLGSIIVILVW